MNNSKQNQVAMTMCGLFPRGVNVSSQGQHATLLRLYDVVEALVSYASNFDNGIVAPSTCQLEESVAALGSKSSSNSKGDSVQEQVLYDILLPNSGEAKNHAD